GANFDGNRFAQQALDEGAAYAVVDDENFLASDRIILVENSLSMLQQLANYHRQKLKAKIIAVTGSNGKTTTKELVSKVLSKKYKTYSTPGNLNNHIGVPLTLLSTGEDAGMLVVEMGANHQKEIDELCRIAEP